MRHKNFIIIVIVIIIIVIVIVVIIINGHLELVPAIYM